MIIEEDVRLNYIKEFFKKPAVRECVDFIVYYILPAIVVALLIVNYVFQITIVNGNSMEKYLHDGDRLIVEKFVYKFRGLKRGDIVIINKPQDLENERTPIIKRIAAVEGDLVEIRGGSVYVNEKKLDEPYINGTSTSYIMPQYQRVIVPDGHVYVLGDNRMPNESLDSRIFGPVSLKKIDGRAVFRFYPFSDFGRLKL